MYIQCSFSNHICVHNNNENELEYCFNHSIELCLQLTKYAFTIYLTVK